MQVLRQHMQGMPQDNPIRSRVIRMDACWGGSAHWREVGTEGVGDIGSIRPAMKDPQKLKPLTPVVRDDC